MDREALTQFSLKSTRSNSESKTLSVQIFKGCVLWVTLENRCCSYTKSKQIRACLSLLEQVHYWESWLREKGIFRWTLNLEHIEFYRGIPFRSMINIRPIPFHVYYSPSHPFYIFGCFVLYYYYMIYWEFYCLSHSIIFLDRWVFIMQLVLYIRTTQIYKCTRVSYNN